MKTFIENSLLGLAAVIVLTGFADSASAQPDAPPPAKPKIRIESPVPPKPPADQISRPAPYPQPNPGSGNNHEISIKVDSGVNVLLGCVREGSVKVNGWNRNEVRVFIADGNKFAFKTLQKNSKTGDPVWIKVVGSESKKNYGPASECISGSEIEIDAPINATITVKGLEISTKVDSIKKVEVESVGGDVWLSNITHGITVVSRQGDITVEGSNGAMTLDTTTGNILVFEAGPSDIGDVFKAKTSSGTVALQGLQYRRVEVESISGSVAYNGEILNGGSYAMRTSKGSIRMTIPAKSSFQVWATCGFGNFATEIPIDTSNENIMPGPLKSIRGKAGLGEATVKLTTNNGSIAIKKL